MFLERLSCSGIETSEYYIPSGKFNTSPPGCSIQMPNCTMYSYLRAHDACDAEERMCIARSTPGFGNAKEWYDASPMPKGSKLRVGSIAVFDGNCGHVAFVERVIDSTHALISDSSYNEDKSLRDWHYWRNIVVELKVGKRTMSGVGPLLGFIYLPINDVRTERDATKEQIKIVCDRVNVRRDAGTDNPVVKVGCFLPQGVYNVLNYREVDGVMWYKVSSESWVSDGYWLEHYDIGDRTGLGGI